MNYAKVIGKTYSEHSHPSIKGIDIKIIQVLAIEKDNEKLSGKPFFAIDPLGVAIGELVAYEESFQATWAFKDPMIPVDAAIIAIVDSIDIKESG